MEYVDGRLFEELEIAQWGGIPAPAVSPINTSRIYYDETLDYMLLSENGGPYSRLLNILAAAGIFLKIDCSNDPLTASLDIWGNVSAYDALHTSYIRAYHDGTVGNLVTNAGDISINPGGPSDINLMLGDALGVNVVSIQDSGNIEVATIDSDGNINGTDITAADSLSGAYLLSNFVGSIDMRGTPWYWTGVDQDFGTENLTTTGIITGGTLTQTGTGVRYATIISTNNSVAGIRFQRGNWGADAFTDYAMYDNGAGDLYIDKLISSVTTAILQYDEDINRFNLFTNLNIGSAGAGIDPVLTFDGDTDNAVITYDVSDNELDFGDTNTLTIGQMKAGNAGGSNAFVVKSGSKLVFDGA